MASAHSEPPVRSTHRSTDQSWSHGYGEAPLPCGCRRCPVCVRACEKPRVFLWGCVGLGRECFGYAKAPWGVCSKGLPVSVMRRRATLPHPVGCSTIAVPGLSFRVRNGTGRLSWAMAAANLGLSAGKRGFPPACGGSGTGQWTRCVLLLTDRARVRTVLPVRLRGALPGPAPHASRACGCGLPLDH